MSNYESYKNLKSVLVNHHYKTYPLDMVLGSYLALLIWHPSIKFILNQLTLNFSSALKLDSSRLIITYSIHRNDYMSLINGYFPNMKAQNVECGNTVKERLLGLPIILLSIIKASKLLSKTSVSWKDRIKLIFFVSIAIRIVDKLEKSNLQCERYVAFNSSYMVESFLSFYFKKRGVPTYSLQHGMYHRYENAIPIDVINYENCCADTLLLWGEYSRDEISRLVPNSVCLKVVGNPLVNKNTVDEKNISSEIYVFLPRVLYDEEIRELLGLIKEDVSNEFIIRPHPTVNDLLMANIDDSLKHISIDRGGSPLELIKKNKFKAVVAFNSTTFFDAIYFDQKTLYFNANPEINISDFLFFTSHGDFVKILDSDITNERFDGEMIYARFFYDKFEQIFLN